MSSKLFSLPKTLCRWHYNDPSQYTLEYKDCTNQLILKTQFVPKGMKVRKRPATCYAEADEDQTHPNYHVLKQGSRKLKIKSFFQFSNQSHSLLSDPISLCSRENLSRIENRNDDVKGSITMDPWSAAPLWRRRIEPGTVRHRGRQGRRRDLHAQVTVPRLAVQHPIQHSEASTGAVHR